MPPRRLLLYYLLRRRAYARAHIICAPPLIARRCRLHAARARTARRRVRAQIRKQCAYEDLPRGDAMRGVMLRMRAAPSATIVRDDGYAQRRAALCCALAPRATRARVMPCAHDAAHVRHACAPLEMARAYMNAYATSGARAVREAAR